MNKGKPVISIIVPAYNAEPYIEQCLDSLVNQNLEDIEIILLNDGSTDNTGEICNIYVEKDIRIKLINKENTGVSDTRNKGIELATGEYIMFVDADDWIDAETSEKSYKEAKKNDVDVLLWSYVREHKNRSIKKKINLREGLYEKNQIRYCLQRRMVGLVGKELRYPENADAISVVWAKLYKTKLLKPAWVRFVDTKIIGSGEDALFNLYAFENAQKAYFLNKHFSHYRRFSSTSYSNTYKSWLFDRWQNLYKYMEDFIKEKHLPDYFFEALDNRRCLSIIGLGLTELNVSNKKTFWKKEESLKKILNNPDYLRAFKNLSLNHYYRKPHWFLFFFFCKRRFTSGVMLLLLFMKRLKRIV